METADTDDRYKDSRACKRPLGTGIRSVAAKFLSMQIPYKNAHRTSLLNIPVVIAKLLMRLLPGWGEEIR